MIIDEQKKKSLIQIHFWILKKKKFKKKIPFLAENVCIAMWEMVQSKEQYFFYYHEQKFKLDWLLPEGMGGGS